MDERIESLLSALTADEEGAQPEPAADEMRERLQALERRVEEARPAAGEEDDSSAPKAPSELVLLLQSRVDLLQQKLEAAQQEALRAGMALREREELQRQARREVEDLFRTIREQQRAAAYDGKLRQGFGLAQQQLRELEERLALAELRMVPAEEVVRALEDEEGRKELQRRLKQQLEKLSAAAPPAAARPEGAPPPHPLSAPGEPEPSTLAVLLGRISDLERRLEESETDARKERAERERWETGIREGLKAAHARWERAGGPQLLVEATLESLTSSIKERDRLQAEIRRLLEALGDEPPDSGKIGEIRAALEARRREAAAVQDQIDQQTAIVNAWMERN